MPIDSIINFFQISPRLGTAGQPDSAQFEEIQAAGYEVVINLVPSTSSEGLPDEKAIVTGLGMEYVHIPVIWTAPTAQNLDDFFEALNKYATRKVFAHCVLNMRVSAFVFLYRVLVQHVPQETARQAMLEIWQPYDTWQAFVTQALADRTP